MARPKYEDPDMIKSFRLGTSLERELAEKVEALAKEWCMSKSSVLRRLVRDA